MFPIVSISFVILDFDFRLTGCVNTGHGFEIPRLTNFDFHMLQSIAVITVSKY